MLRHAPGARTLDNRVGKAFRFSLGAVGALVVVPLAVVGMTTLYHWRRTLTCEAALSEMRRSRIDANGLAHGFGGGAYKSFVGTDDATALLETAGLWDQHVAGILGKHARWGRTQVYLAGDMVYFVNLTEDSALVDFTCVRN